MGSAINSIRAAVDAAGHTDSLSALLYRCAEGDVGALHRLYLLQAARLKGVALRITGSEAAAEDVLHDVFLSLWREASRFDSARAPASAWLVMLTRFRAMEAARRRGKEFIPAELPEHADEAPDALSVAIGMAEGRALHVCMDRLASRTRQAIRLAFMEGRTHADIARAWNLPLGTVKSLIRRGLADLRRCLEP